MFKTAFAGVLAAVASAQIGPPDGMHIYTADPPAPSVDLVITQTTGEENFSAIPSQTYADPVSVVKGSTQKFNVGGIWRIADADVTHVNFKCRLYGVVVFDETWQCNSPAANDFGTCTVPTGVPGEDWIAQFGFDVPAVTPPLPYYVTVQFLNADETVMFTVESDFLIR